MQKHCFSWEIQKRSGDPNAQYFSKSTAVQMGGVLPYKWEADCSTNGRRIAGFSFLLSLDAGKYSDTNGGRTAVLFRQVVGVGVSETLPRNSATTKMENYANFIVRYFVVIWEAHIKKGLGGSLA